MEKTVATKGLLLFLLALLGGFGFGCGGDPFPVPLKEIRFQTNILRVVAFQTDNGICVYSRDVFRNVLEQKDEIVFTCPCYIGQANPTFNTAEARIMMEKLIIELPEGASYDVRIRSFQDKKS